MSRRIGILICILIAVLFFADALIGERTVIPSGFIFRHPPWNQMEERAIQEPQQQFDLVYQFYPWAHYFKESVNRGEFPLWNPYNYLGTPFFANPQTAMLFPPNWLHLVLPLRYSFTLVFMFKLGLALVGTFLWLKHLKLGDLPALAGAFVYGLSMHMLAGLAFPYTSVEVLLPWALLFTSRIFANATRKGFACLLLLISLVMVAGQPQSALPVFLAMALTAGVVAWGSSIANVRRPFILLSAAFVFSLAITAVQTLPILEYLNESMVSLGPRIIKSGYPYSVGSLLTFLIPDFFGTPLNGSFWGFPGYNDSAFYLSTAGLILALLAWILVRRAERAQLVLPTLMAGLAIGILLGVPLIENLLDLPGFNLMRRNKFVFLLIFALAHLAAVTLERLSNQPVLQFRRFLLFLLPVPISISVFGLLYFQDYLSILDPESHALSSALLTFLILAISTLLLIWAPARWRSTLITLVIFLDLSFHSYSLNTRGSASNLYPEPAAISLLEGPRPRLFGTHNSYAPNSNMVSGLEDVRGYDVITPVRFFRYMQEIDSNLGNALTWFQNIDPDEIGANTRMRRIIGGVLDTHGEELRDYLESDSYWSVSASRIENQGLFDLLQVRYFMTAGTTAPPGFNLINESPGLKLFERPSASRARLYCSWEEVNSGEALSRMKKGGFETVFVEANLPEARGSTTGQVELLQLENSSSRYRVQVDSPMVLVEFARYSPGWKVVLDDREESEVFPAHHIFRGTYVPAGEHIVEFRYSPKSFLAGLIVTAVGFLGFLVLCYLIPSRAGIVTSNSASSEK